MKRRSRAWLVRLALAVGGPAVLLGLTEGGLHLALGPPRLLLLPDNFEYGYVEPLKPFFRADALRWPGRPAVYRPQRRRAVAVEFQLPKPVGTARILVVGGSVALPFSELGAYEPILQRVLPGRTVEFISCAMGGYDSERDLGVLREVLRYAPDLLIVLTGNNEYFRSLIARPRLFLLSHSLSRLHIYSLLSRAMIRAGVVEEGIVPVPPSEEDLRFERNLRAMGAAARAAGVPLVLCTLPANLRDSMPASRQYPPLDHPGFFEAWMAWERRGYVEAVRGFRRYLRDEPQQPFAHYALAKSLEALGRGREAAAHYRQAADLDRPGERASPSRNALIRRVAREEGAILADIETLFSSLSPGGVPGRDRIRDSVHWDHTLYPLVTMEILRAIDAHNRARGTQVLAPTARWRWGWLDADQRRALRDPPMGEENRKHRALDMAYSGMAKAIMTTPEFLWLEGVNMMRLARREAPALFEGLVVSTGGVQGLFERPWLRDYRDEIAWSSLWVHVGEVYRLDGLPSRALEFFERAVRSDPGHYQARLRLAIALASTGRRTRAREVFLDLSRDRPDRAETWLWMESLLGKTPDPTLSSRREKG